ncbi:MAG: Mg2+/Co2+ transporter [Elusimicrobia bacterium]|nr:MAG: Mg2+/Co2+ transporter [Elusimicrobiota bacterium]KAF0153167.1 MAG: Mg2+/Co2+ transporter [Elusimicrobiota bacterium]
MTSSTIQAPKETAVPSAPEELAQALSGLDTPAAAALLERAETGPAMGALRLLDPQAAEHILSVLPAEHRDRITGALPKEVRDQWASNLTFPGHSVGRMMDPVWAVFRPEMTVAQAVEELRELVKREFITYAFVTDAQSRLIGVIVMRDLLFADPRARLEEVMLKAPFSLRADMQLMDAMREVLTRHFPVYPVTNSLGVLVGAVRGRRLFEAQAIEISAQAGSMVGVEKEEKLSTSWQRSFRYRHPWLQLNLLTAFVAGGVVSLFQGTIDQIVILAAFLPVLAGQSGNAGCQALAVTIRGMTLHELKDGSAWKLMSKESLLGLFNGFIVGLVAGAGMFLLAKSQGNPQALPLALIVVAAMTGSCVVSGLFGAVVPIALKRLGADPATASSIFLTTATDVASMGLLLALATVFLL